MRFTMKKILLLLLLLPLTALAGNRDTVVVIHTDYGDMTVYLYKATPKHRANFLKLASEGFYDSTAFHRVIENFMIQGGDPNSKPDGEGVPGQGGPGYTIEAEFVPKYHHKFGALAAARQGDQVNPQKRSSGSQFYIVQGQNYTETQLQQFEAKGISLSDAAKADYKAVGGTPHLDGGYTVFGEVIDGLEVIGKIAAVKKRGSTPKEPVRMTMEVVPMKTKKMVKQYGERSFFED